MADDLNLELEEASKAPKPKKKFTPLLAAVLLIWVLAAVGNYFYMKATYVPPAAPPPQSEKKPVTSIDLSDVPGTPQSHEEQPSDSVEQAALDNSPRIDSLRSAIAELTTESATRDSLIKALAAAIEESKKPAPVPEAAPKTEPDSLEVKRSVKLAKIVEAMAPEDAAKMLMPLSDDMVTYILLRLKQRQAAQIMAALPASRAADISRAIIQPMVQ